MAKKQTVTSETPIISAAGAAPTRAKRTTTTKHSVAKKVPAPAPAILQASPVQVNREEVAKLAYLYWEARGHQGGSQEADWVRAEQELLGRES